MFRKLLRPEALLLLLAVFFYIRQLTAGKEGYDIHFHDTYYVVQWPWWFAPMPILLLLVALIYRQTRNHRQFEFLRYFHVLSFLSVPVLTYLLSPASGTELLEPRLAPSFVRDKLPYLLLLVAGLWLLLGQLAFLVNLSAGFIRGKKSTGPVQ